ncbi:MAG: DUF5711 family protein [Oscillospiraceae bacterium]
MPKYEKRSVKKTKPRKIAKPKSNNENLLADIPMKNTAQLRKEAVEKKRTAPQRKAPGKSSSRSADLKLVKGYKKEKKIKALFSFSAVVALILIIAAVNFITPTGIVESVQNGYAKIGVSSFPKSLTGDNVISMKSMGGAINVLSDTYYETYSSAGKQMTASQHGFLSPQMEVSSARTLVFDRGGTGVKVYNHSRLIIDKKTENEIYCADIGRRGTIAFATKSKGYAAQVEVLNKSFETKFKWFSPDNLISDVAVNSRGDKIAVCELFARDGEYVSKISVFDFKDAVSEVSYEFPKTVITSIENLSDKSFAAISDTGAKIINWDKYSKSEIIFDSPVKLVRVSNKKIAVMYDKGNNKISSTVAVYNDAGTHIGTFNVNDEVKNLAITNKNLYCVTSESIKCFDFAGNVISSENCGFHTEMLTDINNSAVYISQSEIIKYTARDKE